MVALRRKGRPPRTGVGWWAWLLQRITGVALVVYLLLHIGVISTGTFSEASFDDVLRILQRPPFVILDLGLLAAVLYHALNGLRVLLFDLGFGIRAQAALFWGALLTTAGTLGVATYFSLPLVLR